MTTATLTVSWSGRSGTDYLPVAGAAVRRGGMATVRKVVARREDDAADATPLALKTWLDGDEASLDRLQREAKAMSAIGTRQDDLPCPRLVDLVGEPMVTALVMEWCPQHLAAWWEEVLAEPDSLGRLFSTVAEVARRVGDYHQFFANGDSTPIHGAVKPTNILLASDGRWLLSDFGALSLEPREVSDWEETQRLAVPENTIAPEVLFGAEIEHGAAADVWSLGATLFTLLRMRRMVVDGVEQPKNGTHSPRFSTERTRDIHALYHSDPSRFAGRPLDPSYFEAPLRLADEDRKAVHSALAGWLGNQPAETAIADRLLETLDRAMSIDPEHRFATPRDLAASLEDLTRFYIQIAATDPDGPPPQAPVDASTTPPGTQDIQRTVEDLRRRLEALETPTQERGRWFERTLIALLFVGQLVTLGVLGVTLVMLLVLFV